MAVAVRPFKIARRNMLLILGTLMVASILAANISDQKPPLSLWDGETFIKQFSADNQWSSREANEFGVWIKDNRVYKLLLDESQSLRLAECTSMAIAEGLPTPPVEVSEATWIDKQRQAHKVYLAEMEVVSGRMFFHLNTRGHPKELKSRIKYANNCQVWRKTHEAMEAALKINISDPQGFFDEQNSLQPINFIDVHCNHGVQHVVDVKNNLEALLRKCTNGIQKLKNKGKGKKKM